MGRNESDFEKGRAQGDADRRHNRDHPIQSGAGLGKPRPEGKSEEFNRGYDRGKENAKKNP